MSLWGSIYRQLGPFYRSCSSNLNLQNVSGSMTSMASLERRIDFLQLAVELSTRYRLLGQFPRLAAVTGSAKWRSLPAATAIDARIPEDEYPKCQLGKLDNRRARWSDKRPPDFTREANRSAVIEHDRISRSRWLLIDRVEFLFALWALKNLIAKVIFGQYGCYIA